MRRFNLQVKRNNSCQCTDSSKTSSASAVTCCGLAIIASYEVAFLAWDTVTIAV